MREGLIRERLMRGRKALNIGLHRHPIPVFFTIYSSALAESVSHVGMSTHRYGDSSDAAGPASQARPQVEKDYWVTHTLWTMLHQGFKVWFKGGRRSKKTVFW